MSNIKRDPLIDDVDKTRSILNESNRALSPELLSKNIFGLIIFLVVFVYVIPHILLKTKHYIFGTLYFSNLDLIATVLGFSGGPYNIWEYLFNPTAETTYGFLSSTVINYLSLMGVGYVCIDYATKHKNLFGGLAMLSIILPITYLLPGNVLVYGMNRIAGALYKMGYGYYMRWFITVISGLLIIISIISTERGITLLFLPMLEKMFKRVYMIYK